MIQLEEGYKIGEYRVSYFIKEGLFNGTYRIADEKGESFFMKFYDFDAVPAALRRLNRKKAAPEDSAVWRLIQSWRSESP